MQRDAVKFACLSLDCFATSDAQSLAERLAGDFWVEPPWEKFDLKTWAKEIGTWRLAEVTDANVFVWVTANSQRLDVNDGENRILSNRLHTFWKGLQLAWSSTLRSTAWILTGSLKNEKPDVSQLTWLFPTFDKTPPVSLSPAVLRLAAETSVDLERTFASGLLHGRVERGLTSFFSSMGSGYLDDSIPS